MTLPDICPASERFDPDNPPTVPGFLLEWHQRSCLRRRFLPASQYDEATARVIAAAIGRSGLADGGRCEPFAYQPE